MAKDACSCKIGEWDQYLNEEKKKADAEARMLTAINLIAGNHCCKVVEIDFEKHIINLSGTKEAEHDCAVAIGDYIESAGGELF